MSVRDKFRRLWEAKFPDDEAPVLPCLDGPDEIDVAAVERNLQRTNELIADLSVQLRKQEFVADFLWDTVHALKEAQDSRAKQARLSVFPTAVDDDFSGLDVPIPLQDEVTVSFCEGLDDSGPSGTSSPSVESRDSLKEYSRNSVQLVKQHSADSILNASEPRVPPNRYRKKSESLLDWDGPDREDSIVEGSRTRSLDSGKILYNEELKAYIGKREALPLSAAQLDRPEMPLPNQTPGLDVLRGKRLKPIPAPRTSIMKSFAGRVELSPAGSSDVSNSPSPTADAGVGLSRDAGQKRVMRSFQGDTKAAVAGRRGCSSMKNLQAGPVLANKPIIESPGADSPTSRPRVNTLDGLVSPRPSLTRPPDVVPAGHRGSRKGSSLYDATDYEEAMPVRREFVEPSEVSSDEDEPLYYNLMLLKQQTLNRVQTLYSKAGANGALGGGQAAKFRAGAGQRLGLLKESNQANVSLSGDSVRSTGSDSVFDDKSGIRSWRKRTSMSCATESVDSQSECDELDSGLPLCPEDEKLQMRKWVIKSILESEHSYLNILDILMQYMQTFKNLLLGSAQAVISTADLEVIFDKIPDLHRCHKMFVHDLEPKVENWSSEQQVADLFKTLAQSEFKLAPEYLKNNPVAVAAIHRCWQENVQFAALTKEIQVKGMKEKPSLEELLHKPIIRFQRNTLVLHDLIKCTPTSHADYDTLMKTLQLAQEFLDNVEKRDDKAYSDNQRYVAKQGLIVEKVDNIRKLRHLILFNDVLVCARQKISAKQKIHFELKWFIPLMDLAVDDKVCAEEEKLLAECQQQEIETLQRRVSELQLELKAEMRLCRGNDDAQRQWSFHNKSRGFEKIKKKLLEQQAAMIKASPRFIFRVHNRRHGRQYTLLIASDYERTNWRITVADLLSRAAQVASTSSGLSSADLQNLLNSQKLPIVSTLAAVVGVEDLRLEEEHLFGNLYITIHRLQGLKQPEDTYCAIEVDSFSHFFMKAKTKIIAKSAEPVWNEDFDVDLEGAQTIRILCYKVEKDVGTLIGTCALEMSKAWLRGDFQEKIVSINKEISVTISLRYLSRDQILKRTLSSVKGGLFGARLAAVARREGGNVPKVVQTCIDEVERRGMAEVGIYRVSGVSGDIQRLKKAFEKNTNSAIQLAKEMDVNVVTGLLKLYFRELPEALFTDALYSGFVKGMSLSDPEAKEKFIQSLMDSLPEPNRSIIFCLLDHLIKVAGNEPENKMTLQNLSTVFGPTLLRPAVKETQQQTLEELFSMGTRDAMTQTSILLYILTLRSRNVRV